MKNLGIKVYNISLAKCGTFGASKLIIIVMYYNSLNRKRNPGIHIDINKYIKENEKLFFTVELHSNGSERVCVIGSTHANDKASTEMITGELNKGEFE